MGFFNNSFSVGAIPKIDGIQYDADFGGALNIATEAYEDQLDIIRTLHAADMLELSATASGCTESYDIAYENAITDFFSKIKEFFKKLFAKIAAFFKSFYEKHIAMKKSNDSFARKYLPIIQDLAGGGYVKSISIMTYPKYADSKFYTSALSEAVNLEDKSSRQYEAAKKSIEHMISRINELSKDRDMADVTAGIYNNTVVNADTYKEEMRNTVDAGNDEWGQSMFVKYYRGSTTTSNVSVSVDQIISALDVLPSINFKEMKRIETKLTADYNELVKMATTAETEAKKDEAKKPNLAKVMTSLVGYTRVVKEAGLNNVTALRVVVNDWTNMIKSATLKAVNDGRKNKAAKSKA